MKKNSWLGIGTAAIGLLALLAISHSTLRGSDSRPDVNVSSTPINRDARLATSYAPIVKKAAPSVVNIYSTRYIKQRFYQNPMMADPLFRQFFGNQLSGGTREMTQRLNWLGSGSIVTPDGYILTANHVVEGADEIKVGISDDKREYSAKIVGTDPDTDIAVLKIEAHGLPAIVLGDSSQLEVGDVVLAIGNPFGLGQTVTRGIISALGRSLADADDANSEVRTRYQDFIQTDASINKGNSGGALVDAEGRLIGINDAIVSPSGTSAGIGFAVPINMARNVMEGIINGGKVARGYLGINPQDVDAGLAQGFGLASAGGALIAEVGPGSPAEKSGLKSGDIILAINDRKITGADNLTVTISQMHPGSLVNIKIFRNGQEKIIAAKLGEREMESTAASKPDNTPTEIAKADMLDGVVVVELSDEMREHLRAPSDLNGALVRNVSQESNAAVAGLQAGDIILEVNHQPVTNRRDAVQFCKAARSQQILLKVWRSFGNVVGTRYLSVDNTRHT